MRQVLITKRHRRPDSSPEPLPLDPRDPDVVRAKRLARRQTSPARRTSGDR
jgi:hypothetical protein